MSVQLVALGAVVLAPRWAAADEEVRISLLKKRAAVAVSGPALAIYDADVGDRLYLAAEVAKKRIRAKDGRLLVAGRSVRRVIVEARDAVRVERGVYYGRLEIGVEPKHPDRLFVLNLLPLETYLLGIVGSEMNPSWPIEALKAQAVAARSYALKRRMMMRAANRPYDLEDSVLSQVYKGAERIRPPVIRAVTETRGEVLAHRHDLVEALFHSTCGGHTVSAQSAFGRHVPYLRPRPCRWCRASNRHRWDLSVPLNDLSRRLANANLIRGDLRRVSRNEGAGHVVARDARGDRRIHPKDVRRAVGFSELYSSRFTAKTRGDSVRFSGRGFGHGVGMCQWGARGLALEGKTYVDILEHYYADGRVRRIY
jgi:stage II sporulation protein D